MYRKKTGIYNCKGGNAKTVLEEAKDISKKHRDYYSGYIVWFDSDAYNPSTDNNLKQSLEASLVWKIGY
jgi:hypothetical protein